RIETTRVSDNEQLLERVFLVSGVHQLIRELELQATACRVGLRRNDVRAQGRNRIRRRFLRKDRNTAKQNYNCEPNDCFHWVNSLTFAGLSDDCASKTYGPTARFIGEEDAFQRMLCLAAFAGPMIAAIGGVNDCSFGADGP